MNKIDEKTENLKEIKNIDILNESALSELNSSVLSGINEMNLNMENLGNNSNYNLFMLFQKMIYHFYQEINIHVQFANFLQKYYMIQSMENLLKLNAKNMD